MTHEERAQWIRRGVLLLLAVGVLAGVWFFPEKKPDPSQAENQGPTHLIEVLHFHLPGHPESETIADSLNEVGRKYGSQVKVTRIDIQQEPARARAEKVTKPPKVVMMAGEIRACKFQGVWTQAQIERKIDEILHGLERMGKDWRPDVQGMQPATQAATGSTGSRPASPPVPAKPDFPTATR